jgi:ADP-ribose pyrophosphatase YjhB (NUDIX family)
MRIHRPLLRLVLTAFQLVRRAYWAVTGRKGEGVHAIAVTPEGNVVLVRLTYAPGWRLPGGGRGRCETAEDGVLRELREEIGLTSHGDIRVADGSAGESGYFIVANVAYEPKQTLEVEEVRAFSPDALPSNIPKFDRRLLMETFGHRA